MSPSWQVLLCVAFSCFSCNRALAHEIGVSRGNYEVVGREVRVSLVFAARELVSSSTETTTRTHRLADGLRVMAEGSSCARTMIESASTEQDGLRVDLRYECPHVGPMVEMTAGFLPLLVQGHRHIVRTSAGTVVVHRSNAEFRVGQSAKTDDSSVFSEMLLQGIEHILVGWDHLAFLLGVLLIGGRLRSMIGAVSAFTVGHTVTLVLASIGVFAPSPEVVEPLIALSIVYVGVENFWVKSAERRWLLTLLFGLVHGLGFASVLAELGLPAENEITALFGFNLGVELGQLLVLCVVAPLLYTLRQSAWFRVSGLRIANAGIIALGCFWLVERLA